MTRKSLSALLAPTFAAALAFDSTANAAAAPACDPAALGTSVLDLFSSAPPETRVAAALRLGECRDERAIGALRAVLARDADAEVRLAAATALGTVGTPAARAALVQMAQDASAPRLVRSGALAGLAQSGDFEAIQSRLLDPAEASVLRADALRLLDDSGRRMPSETLQTLADGPAGPLARAASGLLEKRKAAALGLALVQDAGNTRENAASVGSPTATPPVATGRLSVVGKSDAAPDAADEPQPTTSPTPPPAAGLSVQSRDSSSEPAPSVPVAVASLGAHHAVSLRSPVSPPPLRPPVPEGPADGTQLAVATSAVAGASLMSFLSMLAQQNSTGVLMLTGTAGMVIGGGTSWALARFYSAPELSQAAWYTNVAAWGTLLGLMGGTLAMPNEKLRWGALVAGESLGLALGTWSSVKWKWTASQMVLADSLLLGAGLANAGVRGLRGLPLEVTPVAGFAAAPVMVLAAIAARNLDPSAADLWLLGTTTAGLGWSGALLGSGANGEALLSGRRSAGGAMAGLGFGYLTAAAAGAFSEVAPKRSGAGLGGMLAGNLIGLGAHMVMRPGESSAWALGAGLGGLSLGAGAFAYQPYAVFGKHRVALTLLGVLYGGGSWAAAQQIAMAGPVRRGNEPTIQLAGGVLAGSVAGGIAGLASSRWIEPKPRDRVLATTTWLLGMSAGLGTVRLATVSTDDAVRYGVLGGAAAGVLTGGLVAHATKLRATDWGAGLVGLGYGGLAGALVPTLNDPVWQGNARSEGGAEVGVALGAVAGAALAHATDATPAQAAVVELGGLFGLAMGLGTGLMLPIAGYQPARIGVVAGFPAAALAAGLLDRPLKLSDGLGEGAAPLGIFSAAFGAGWGVLLGSSLSPLRYLEDTPDRVVAGGALLGASTGLASGFIASKYANPPAISYTMAIGTSLLGTTLGRGVTGLAYARAGREDTVGMMIGSASGLLAGSLVASRVRLRGVDIGAAFVGSAWGVAIGTVAPSLASATWNADRRAAGGALTGLAAGAIGAATLAHAADLTGRQLTLGAVAAGFGLTSGAGFGAMVPVYPGPSAPRSDNTQPDRIGMVAGSVAFVVAAALAESRLHLTEGLGERAGSLALSGSLVGSVQGFLLAAAMDDSGTPGGIPRNTPAHALGGGILFGASTGIATGLVLSKYVEPEPADHGLALSAGALGGVLGLGIAQLSVAKTGRADTIGALFGSTAGLAAGAYAAHHVRLRGPDVVAGLSGMAWGGFMGTLAPSLGELKWDSGRPGQGGMWVGAALGGTAATAFSHWADATGAEVRVADYAAALGFGLGGGIGLMFPVPTTAAGPTSSYQPWRIGAVGGSAAMGLASLLAVRRLHWLDENILPLTPMVGAATGAAWGVLLAGAVDDSGRLADTSERRVWGGALAGVSAGLTTGLIVGRYVRPDAGDDLIATAGGLLGALGGQGFGRIIADHEGREQTLSTLLGSMILTGAAAAVQAKSPLESTDALALVQGGAFGSVLGMLGPNLSHDDWPGLDERETSGWTMLGATGGALAATALRHATDASAGDTWLATLGGVDGLLTGLGTALLISDANRSPRIGMFAGTLAGAGIGAAAWPHVHLEGGDKHLILAATTVSALSALVVPAIGDADFAAFASKHPDRLAGGALAGLGFGSFAASLAAPFVDASDDLIGTSIAMHYLAAGAGLGAGMLADQGDGTAIATMLATGAAGLLAGGALHDSIEASARTRPMLTLAALEGLWMGAWLPHALRPAGKVTARQQWGGVLGGTLGLLTVGSLATGSWQPSGGDCGLMGLGSALGASLAGGLALSFPQLGRQAATGTMLGGTAVGLAGAGLLAPKLHFGPNATAAGMLGAVLGASEGLTFAWAGRAQTGAEWAGATLFGAGLGSLLGLASSAYPHFKMNQAPAAAGFAAWGAWMGAFAGSLVSRDAHEVTFGGLVGANLGFAGGYALLRSGIVKPGDFGWLSLFAALGTVLGAGVGAPLAAQTDPRPVLAGLAIGPAVGLAVGAIALPKLRALRGGTSGAEAAMETTVPESADFRDAEPTTRATAVPDDR